MAKVAVTFDFNNDEQDQFLEWMNGRRYRSVIQELDKELRDKEKYEHDYPIRPSEVRDMLREAMDDLLIWGE